MLKYKNRINELENKLKEEKEEKEKYIKENIELEKIKNEQIKIINEQKNKINEMNNNINSLKEKNSSLKMKIKRFPFTLNKNERVISIILCSYDENIKFPIICKNNDNFNEIKKQLLNKYPEYNNKKLEFYINGRIIDDNNNLIKNEINDKNTIIIKIK